MALTGKKYSAIHTKTGSDLTSMQDKFDNAKHLDVINFEPEAAIIYQMQKMQDELDYLRTEISSNKDKTTFPGFGTSNSTALVGDTKLISIGANTTVSFGDMVVGGKSSTITITAVHTDPSSGKVTSATNKLIFT